MSCRARHVPCQPPGGAGRNLDAKEISKTATSAAILGSLPEDVQRCARDLSDPSLLKARQLYTVLGSGHLLQSSSCFCCLLREALCLTCMACFRDSHSGVSAYM